MNKHHWHTHIRDYVYYFFWKGNKMQTKFHRGSILLCQKANCAQESYQYAADAKNALA